jgi:hypothetical protein
MLVLRAKCMPSSTKKIFVIILSGYEKIGNKKINCLWGGKLPFMAVIIGLWTVVFDIINILLYAIYDSFTATIGHTFLFFCRMCEVGVQGWQQPFPGATGWFPRLLPEDFSRNSLWLL